MLLKVWERIRCLGHPLIVCETLDPMFDTVSTLADSFEYKI